MSFDHVKSGPGGRWARWPRPRSARSILLVLFAANLFNFYDRALPAVIIEPIKEEFSLTDLDIGVLGGAFTVTYALAGLPLGRLADRRSRTSIMGWGLVFWSALTAASGLAWNYASALATRIGVGIGEASYAPAANSTIADLFPRAERARAVARFQLGLPIGLTLAFFTVGGIAEAFGTWRAPFFVVAVPGLLIAGAIFLIREPGRGAAEDVAVAAPRPADRAFRRILRIPTIWWLIISGIAYNLAGYAVNTFSVPLFQRYFGLSLTSAAAATGVVVGLTGIVGLLAGGVIADRASRRSPGARVLVAAVGMLAAAPATLIALRLGPDAVGAYIATFGLGWLLAYSYATSVFPALADVVQPRLRSTAVAVFFAAFYLLGAAMGPVIAGALSDSFADRAVDSPALRTLTERGVATATPAQAVGLHDSLLLITPTCLLIAGLALLAAARTISADHTKMRTELAAAAAPGPRR